MDSLNTVHLQFFAGTCFALLCFSVHQSHGAGMVVGLSGNPNDSSYGTLLHANESQQQEAPLVMKPITGGGKHVPMNLSASHAGQVAAGSSEFLNSFGSLNGRMLWRSHDIRLSAPTPLHASILNKPFYFLNDTIANSGSPSASSELFIGAKKDRFLKIRDNTTQKNSANSSKNNNLLIKNGKIDMDLILIISAGVSGLILILIPERKRKRDLIKEANLALLRRPRR